MRYETSRLVFSPSNLIVYLEGRPHTAHQRFRPAGGRVNKTAGILLIPVKHEGHFQGCEEEACVIEGIVSQFLRCQVWDGNTARPRKLKLDDILMVAPFNMQVQLLKNVSGQQGGLAVLISSRAGSHRTIQCK